MRECEETCSTFHCDAHALGGENDSEHFFVFLGGVWGFFLFCFFGRAVPQSPTECLLDVLIDIQSVRRPICGLIASFKDMLISGHAVADQHAYMGLLVCACARI